MFFLETTKIIKVTIFISVSRLLYLTDPIHSTKRYNNLNGFRDIFGFICPTRGLLGGPGSIRIRSSSGNHLGIIRESFGNHLGIIWDAWAGWAGWAEPNSLIHQLEPI